MEFFFYFGNIFDVLAYQASSDADIVLCGHYEFPLDQHIPMFSQKSLIYKFSLSPPFYFSFKSL